MSALHQLVNREIAVAEAVRLRTAFETYESRDNGREWSLSDLVAGLATDVGDLARGGPSSDRDFYAACCMRTATT